MRFDLVTWSAALIVALGAADARAAGSKPGTPDADGIRRDPAGQKGISPYNEQLAKGRKAFEAKDLDGAIAAFQQAIAQDGQPMLGHILLAQTQWAKGDRAAAAATIQGARQSAGTEPQQSKLLFLDAEVAERTAEDKVDGPEDTPEDSWKAPKEAWSGYASFVAGHTAALDYRASSTERDKQIEARIKREKDYAIVRKRIADNAKKRGK
jgi:hypothetical protein